MRKNINIIFLLILSLIFVFPQFSRALTISPLLLELGGFPGDNIKTSFRVFNETDKTGTYYLSTANFKPKEEGDGEPVFESDTAEESLATWINYQKDPIVLKSQETRQIEFSINIPPYAPAGGHFAAIFLSDQPPQVSGTTGVGVSSKIGMLILLRVEGKIIEEGKLTEFKLKDNKKVFNYLPVDFIFTFENSGNVHLKPTGFIEIRNLFGNLSASLPVEEKNVLPLSSRTFKNQWLKKLYNEPPKSFLEKFNYQRENFALGRYIARLNLKFGKDGKVALGELSFWVLPWQLILVYLVIGIAIVVALSFAINSYNKFIISKALKKRQSNKH